MKEHLIHALIILTTNQDGLAIFYMCLVALALRYTSIAREILRSKTLLCLATGLGVLVMAVYLMALVNYLFYPNYVDHFEPTVASIAWLGMHGHALYPNWVTDDVYGIVYGPVLFLLHGVFLLIDPTVTASKALGAVSLLVAFGLVFIVIKQKVANNLTSFLLIASLVMLFVRFNRYPYWSRAEPFLILIGALALVAATRLRPLAAGAIIGVLAGLAAGLKLHGFIYVAPTAIMALARVKILRDRAIVAIIGVSCAIIIALLPFCLEEISLVGYWQYLHLAANHGLSLDLFKDNLFFALVLFAIVLFAIIYGIWFWRRPAINPSELWLLAGLCVSTAIAVVIGSVSGGGPYHLLPFVPVCLYAAVAVSGAPATEVNRMSAIIFLLLLLAYSPGGSRVIIYYYRNFQTEHDKIIELQTYLNAYPDAQIGISDDGHYSDTYYRIFSVLQGHPLHVDFSAWEEMAYGGIPERNIMRFIKRCEIPTWILPLGAPFSKLNLYTNLPMLSDDFRRAFSKNYRLIQIGQAYQVWRCRSSIERREQN